MRTLTSLIAVLLFTTGSSAMAEKIYRWVDDNGQTHFGSQPPENNPQQAEMYNLHVSPPAEGTEGYKIPADTPQDEQDTSSQAVRSLPSMTKEEADAGCTKAKEYKSKLATNYNRRFKQEDGIYRPLTDEQRATENKKANDMVDYYCNKQSSKRKQ